MSTFVILLSAVVTLLVSYITVRYLHYQHCFTYWKKRNLETKQPVFPGGNLTPTLLGQENFFVHLQNLYNEFKQRGLPHAGIYSFNAPIYFPIDPEIIKRILITDFEYFMDRGVYCDEENAPLTAHLFALSGSRWRELRTRLTPAFTSGKLKLMFNHTFMKYTNTLIKRIKTYSNTGNDVNIHKIFQAFTADSIASATLGLDCDALNGKDTTISDIMAKVINPGMWPLIQALIIYGFQNPGILMKVSQDNKVTEKFFKDLIHNTITYRINNNVQRNDFLNAFMNVDKTIGLSDTEILAQTFIFFLGGLETSASVLATCMHSLAHNQDIQQRLRNEIVNNLGEDYTKYTYDGIVGLSYLDKVIKETLRMYPVAGALNRLVVKDYKVPGTDVVLEKGTIVLISSLGLQRDPEYYPNPMKFDPERFDDKSNIVQGTYFPFGEGPRYCMGKRYGLIQMKLAVAAIISQFKVLPSEKTPEYFQYDKVATTLFLSRNAGFFIRLQSI